MPTSKKHKKLLGAGYAAWVLVLADVLTLALCFCASFILRAVFPGSLQVGVYLEILPILLLFPLLFFLSNLYPGIFLHPAEELKRLFLATSAGFLMLSTLFFLLKNADEFSRIFFLTAWILALMALPTVRLAVRKACSRKSWWRTPIILVAERQEAGRVLEHIGQSRFWGFSPVALVYPQDSGAGAFSRKPADMPEHSAASACAVAEQAAPIPCFALDYATPPEEVFEPLAEQYPSAWLVLHLPSLPEYHQEQLIDRLGPFFHQTLILPGLSRLHCVPSQIIHMQGGFALTLRRNLADNRRKRIKRLLDTFCVLCLSPIVLPVFALLALLVKCDSPGPVLYTQKRIGQNGRTIQVVKFRSMVRNADQVLQDYLDADPEAAAQWRENQKLKDDPRITAIGRLLRTTSLDELPQIINVLRGDMSLVGPRPIVEDEIAKYGSCYQLYTQVRPGITGLWQVSGRNDTTYEERVALDRFYITNWSVALDIYILLRTVPEVLLRKGAY